MTFIATFNNISVISCRSVSLMEKIGENHRPVASYRPTLSLNVVSCIPHNSGILTHNVLVAIGTDCIGSCKSNLRTIMTTMILRRIAHTGIYTTLQIQIQLLETGVCLIMFVLISKMDGSSRGMFVSFKCLHHHLCSESRHQ